VGVWELVGVWDSDGVWEIDSVSLTEGVQVSDGLGVSVTLGSGLTDASKLPEGDSNEVSSQLKDSLDGSALSRRGRSLYLVSASRNWNSSSFSSLERAKMPRRTMANTIDLCDLKKMKNQKSARNYQILQRFTITSGGDLASVLMDNKFPVEELRRIESCIGK
jgi:hypothetical protein